MSFECNDCLKVDISKAKLVYLDNEIWDSFLTTEIYRKMGTELPLGALVIGWKEHVHQTDHGWKNHGAVGVKTSWSDDLMDVYILERTAEPDHSRPAPLDTDFTIEDSNTLLEGDFLIPDRM